MQQIPILFCVLPCYNEEEVIMETARQLKQVLRELVDKQLISDESKVLFVNDGSRDRTWEMIEQLHQENSFFCGISLSHNKGHQNALLAGLMTAKDYCDVAISLDADLQDDIHAMEQMIINYKRGDDIVYGVRSSRKKDSWFKRESARAYYRFMKGWSGVDLVYDHADYRLMSRRALEDLSGYTEVNLFLRGIVPMLGYRTSIVTYERNERFAGESKYPLKKMISFAFDGITSFSTKPLQVITGIGILIFFVSILILIWILVRKLTGYTVDGWSSLMVSLWGLGGIQTTALGIIGQYIGKIYAETKRRPRYQVAETLIDAKKHG